MNPHKNRVISRGGALLSLIILAKSKNTRLTKFATDHLLNVHTNRAARSEKREIIAIMKMLERGSDAEKAWAAKALGNIAWGNTENRVAIRESGGLALLVKLVKDWVDGQRGELSQSVGPAAHSLWNFAVDDDGSVFVGELGCVPALLELARDGTDEQKKKATLALWSLIQTVRNGDEFISCGGVEVLAALVRDGTDILKEHAAGALRGLLATVEAVSPISEAGGIESLVALIRSGNDAQKENAAGVLWNLTADEVGVQAVTLAGGIPPFVDLVRDGTDNQKTNATNALWNMSVDADVAALIIATGATALLLAMLRDGNKEEKASAVAILGNVAANVRDGVLADVVAPLVVLVRDGDDLQKTSSADVLSYLAGAQAYDTQLAAAGAIGPLVTLLESGNDEQKEAALAVLYKLPRRNPANQTAIAQQDGIAPLVALVRHGTNASQLEHAADALWHLAFQHSPNAGMIAAHGGVEALSELVTNQNADLKLSAAEALGFLEIDDKTRKIVAENGGVGVLVEFIHSAQGVDR